MGEKEESKETKSTSDGIDEARGMAAISYIWILFLIPLLAKRDSEFAMYHAKQGLVFFVYCTIVGFIVWVPVIGWLLSLIALILLIIGLVNALGGKKAPLPIIGKIAEGFKI